MEQKQDHCCNGGSRRNFIKKTTALTALSIVPSAIIKAGEHHEAIASYMEKTPVQLEINGKPYKVLVDPGVSLLDMLRENVGLTGTKKGCDPVSYTHLDVYKRQGNIASSTSWSSAVVAALSK